MKRVLIEHIPTGKKWESDWVESLQSAVDNIEYTEFPNNITAIFPFNGCRIIIPASILNESVRTVEYKED